MKALIQKSLRSLGYEIRRYYNPYSFNKKNGDISPGLQKLVLSRASRPLVLLGSQGALKTYAFLGGSQIDWSWDADVALPDSGQVLVCDLALNDKHWNVMRALKQRYGARIIGIAELVLPFTPILFSQAVMHYFSKIDDIASYYLGEKWWGPFDQLDKLCPLVGKRVIEFGPLDGAQTAGLVHRGVGELICIEARPENFIKTLIAKEVFGWNQVRLIMDDMHNADAVKYGKFDLAFCHGTYYHSNAPFVLLGNLVSLSDNIFIGGYILRPDMEFETVVHGGTQYRRARYNEPEDFTAGVQGYSYYLHGDDLTGFFARRGYKITVIADRPDDVHTKRYYQFLAAR
jgi:hypothetical protein